MPNQLMFLRHLTLAFLLLMLAGCTGCEPIDGSNLSDPCEGRQCRIGSTCEGGECICNDPALTIGPSFCINPQYTDSWVTYDVTPISDTMVVALNGQQWRDLDWENLPERAISFRGWSYARGGDHSIGPSVTLTRSPFNPDTLGIYPITRQMVTYHYIEGCCSCIALFRGRLVNENTIQGYVTTSGCTNPGENGFPPVKYERYPMTWHRLN
ncbi:hypothetical protein QWY85_15545 [Neolewinella lacunae]|uniref:Uncharacterized protein n=1 Tax=Neolewinella lacunae TaxID=1517758 RepID=A0A923PIR2_9BACT|nr:hypothetical protein [Neolewinella lacunae]MBC6994049.1 hypothetical protein [Neolewinella lacunae]MDN3636081.1 hypothetical protein [Neolewinella lacunae]